MTVTFLADENFNRAILVGLQRRVSGIDVVRAQDAGLTSADDPTVLQHAADEGRAVITHDIATMPDFANERVAAGLPMPGLFVARSGLPMAQVIDESCCGGGSERYEWSAAPHAAPMRRGHTAIELDDAGKVSRLTAIYDSSLLRYAAYQSLVGAAAEAPLS